MSISAELLFDTQHGPIITVRCGGKRISIYLMHETGTVTDEADNTGYGIEVKGDWWKLRQMFEPPMMPLADEVVDVKVVLELRKEIERLKEENERWKPLMPTRNGKPVPVCPVCGQETKWLMINGSAAMLLAGAQAADLLRGEFNK